MIEGTLYTAGLAVATVLTAVLGALTWRHRHRPGARPFLLLVVGLAIWMGASVLSTLDPSPARTMLWYRLSYLGIPGVVLGWLLFALQFTGRGEWITRRTVGLLAIEPVLVQVAVWTNPHHGLFWVDLPTDPHAEVAYGFAFWVHALYSYGLLLVGTILLCSFVIYSRTLYRDQVAAITIAITMPWGSNIVYLFTGLTTDPTPMALGVSAAAFAWSMLRYGFMDIVPVARETVLDEMNDGVLVLDVEQRVVDRNRAIDPLLEAGREQIVGEPVHEILALSRLESVGRAGDADGDGTAGGRQSSGESAPAVGEPVATPVESFFAGDPTAERTLEVRALVPTAGDESPERRTYELTLSPFYARKSVRTGQLLVATDITVRKRRERQLGELAAELEHRSREQSALIENIPGAVYRMRAPTAETCTFVSAAATSVTGYDPEAFESGTQSLHDLIHGEQRARVLERKQAAIDTGERYDVTYRIQTREDGQRWVRDVGGGIFTAQGDLVSVVGVILDVTTSKEREQLQVLNRVLRHNIRNEMNVIKGYASMLSERTESGVADEVDVVVRKADEIIRMSEKARIIQHLLGTPAGTTQPIDCIEAVADALTRIDDRYGETVRGNIEVEVAGDLGHEEANPLEHVVYVDAGELLALAFFELIENGIVHDRTTPSIDISVQADEERVIVTISDDGPGMPATERDVLEAGIESPLEHGSGLGLWICQWILQPDGSVRFDVRDDGTKATVSLPRAEVDPSTVDRGGPLEGLLDPGSRPVDGEGSGPR